LALDLDVLTVSVAKPLVALLAVGWLAGALARRELQLPGGAVLAGLLAVFAVMLASVTYAILFAPAVAEAIKWAELLVVFLFAASAIRRRVQVYALLATLFLAGLVQAAIGLFQFATGAGPTFFAIGDFLRAYGTFG